MTAEQESRHPGRRDERLPTLKGISMHLCITSETVGVYCVMDRHNLDAGALFESPSLDECERWADKHNAENVVDKLTRILAGETVEGLVLGSAGISEEFCRMALEEYKAIVARS